MQNQQNKFIAVQCDLDHTHGAAIRVDAKNTSIICFVRLNSRGETDASWENPMNTSRKLPDTDDRQTTNTTCYKISPMCCIPIGTDWWDDTTDPRVLTHRATVDAAPLMTNDTRLYLLCVVSLM